MDVFKIVLPSGESWTPHFVGELNQDKCIGCGRCFKVCSRDVLQLVGINEAGDTVLIAVGADDDDDEEYEKKVMTIAHPENCIGCEACSKICPKKCYTHGPLHLG